MDEVHAQYVVRTPTSFLLAAGVMWALFAVAAGAVVMVPDGWLAMFAVVLAVSAVAFMRQTAYRIGGTRGLVRFFADKVEVPSPHTRTPIAFARGDLAVHVQALRGTVVVMVVPVPVHRSKLLTLHGGGVVRKLSTVVLADPDDEPYVLADLQRFLSGQAAVGRREPEPAPRTAHDDQLDRELAALE